MNKDNLYQMMIILFIFYKKVQLDQAIKKEDPISMEKLWNKFQCNKVKIPNY